MPAALGLPNENELAAVARGLWDEDNGYRYPPCAQTCPPPPGPALPYKVLAVRGDGHAEDVAAVARGLPLGTLLGSWDHMEFPSTLHAP